VNLEKFQARMEKYPNGTTMPNLATQVFSGLLKTPCAADSYTENLSKKEQKFGNSGTLAQEVATGFIYKRGMLPTPNSRDYKDTQTPEKYEARKEKWAEKGINLQLSLPQAIVNQLLPTPKAQDSRHALSDRGKSNLGEEISQWGQDNGIGSQLSPQFVLEMMGFPTDWTELPFLSGETNQSKQEGML
jgi:hypothetical protein